MQRSKKRKGGAAVKSQRKKSPSDTKNEIESSGSRRAGRKQPSLPPNSPPQKRQAKSPLPQTVVAEDSEVNQPGSGRPGRGRPKPNSTNETSNSSSISESDAPASISSPWPTTREHHRELVSAIFDVGIKQSSPLAILEHMSESTKQKFEGLNIERIKSKLQKYRNNKEKSKKEFLQVYDSALSSFSKCLPGVDLHGKNDQNLNDPKGNDFEVSYKDDWRIPLNVRQNFLPSASSLSSGEIAAFLTYTVMTQSSSLATSDSSITTNNSFQSAGNDCNYYTLGNRHSSITETADNDASNSGLIIPKLTDAEKRSPIGMSLAFFVGLFYSMKQEILMRRAEEEEQNAIETQGRQSESIGGGATALRNLFNQSNFTSAATSSTSTNNSHTATSMLETGSYARVNTSSTTMPMQIPGDGISSRPLHFYNFHQQNSNNANFLASSDTAFVDYGPHVHMQSMVPNQGRNIQPIEHHFHSQQQSPIPMMATQTQTHINRFTNTTGNSNPPINFTPSQSNNNENKDYSMDSSLQNNIYKGTGSVGNGATEVMHSSMVSGGLQRNWGNTKSQMFQQGQQHQQSLPHQNQDQHGVPHATEDAGQKDDTL